VGFDGAKDYTFFGVLLEFAEEDKEDAEVNLLHVIFDLKRVLVGKEYFKINHLLLLSFNLVQGRTLLGKNIVPMLV
jgi:hypothetical protein